MIAKVWGPQGRQLGPANSLVGKGETIANFDTHDSSLVTTGTVGKDTEYSNVTQDDNNVIFGNDPNLIRFNRGKSTPTYAQMAAPITAIRQVLSDKINQIDKMKQTRGAEIDKKSKYSFLSRQTKELSDKQFDRLKTPLVEQDRQLEEEHKRLADEQRTQHLLLANCGKDRFAGGADMPFWARMIPASAGITASALQLLRWAKEPVNRIDTYAGSPYSSQGLRTLAGLRINPYSSIQAAKDAERRGAYGLSQQGVTGGRRDTARVAMNIGNQQTAANILSAVQQQNNSYAAQYAQALLNKDDQIAQRKQNASQFDRQDYVASHGKKTKGVETSTANMLNQINSAYTNEFKYNTWRDTADIFRQQLNNDEQKTIAEIADRAAQRRLEQRRLDELSKKPIGNVYNSPYLNNQFLRQPNFIFNIDPFWQIPPQIKKKQS